MSSDAANTATPAVLCISSQVAAGPVGNSAMVPALLALGVTPVALPTVLLSQHPGHGAPEGVAVPANRIGAMLSRLDELGFLGRVRVVVTGYFAEAAQIEPVRQAIARLKARDASIAYLCDPVLGDSPGGLYVKPEIAKAVRDVLVPLADILTPNAFELAWLTGKSITDVDAARRATAGLYGKDVVVTSIASGQDKLITARIRDGRATSLLRPRLDSVAHGAGDVLSGLIAGHLALGLEPRQSLQRSVLAVERVIAASRGQRELDLARGLAEARRE